ncbi:hypothetical protein EG240_01845 [Paenimyroides tangerinum]|uniref:Lipoprotein n=1 Tax=Paenimyroides tangerinum TaxID=2488728 RepID=A0A3P3WC93_9FLAO|nr:hypothetical protein [Paenimyroides tangerinum]RRJ92782.1 hypothetical protein EG240_01845 [Paenimyroides tangerinum]
MFSKNIFTLLLIGVAFVSCKNEEETPKVIYPEEKDNVDFQKIDSTEIKIADLPILLKGTDYMLHPVGDVRVYSTGNSKYGSSKTKHVSYKVSNYSSPEITGYMSNVMFQHKDSLDLKPLTENKMQIQSITFLDEFALKTGKKLLVYSLVDKDTNRDGKYDSNDIKALYVSNADGTNFTKLTPEFQELLDWNVVLENNRLYFRSIEDINKNGEFDSNDTINYYYIDLNAPKWELQSYSPLK